ncbi:flagellar basal body rod protein FlgC [Alkalihalophilus marmarensis]|uniref:Flagellar basal-body rod protein FlgC n=1 Tax=Alkalihalophilus marmarensis DSM 21297 TaxID=1188261 RepID=U6SQE7_9BACI|nr:flagellar basal body rod protein FlgC [Alkalihalophilus marmarensis]ERN53140.1 flagellar basal body rod protein FlgC [Alkalihalophilus marmarensis DSM 21297]MCM3489586.1 flagellar basal body rod protein FlgC [Alkalihalophilus marmarensis]
MTLFSGFNASASALTTQRLRMDVISSNMANAETTRARMVDGEWTPYRRKMVVVEPNQKQPFSAFLGSAMKQNSEVGTGVKASAIVEDQNPFKLLYDPTHPDANEEGYVEMPNVDPLREMVDLMTATRSYEANVTSLNATKNMLMKALEIGR